jgi:hypothetical protein
VRRTQELFALARIDSADVAEFEDAVVLKTFGEVPDNLGLVT